MSLQQPSLIIPVESQVRELDAKLLLAAVAAERGFSVVFGSRAYVHHAMAAIPRGVYLAKSMRRASDRMFGIISDLGHEIAAWDEEGLVRFPDRFYYQRRLSATALERVKILFAWGQDDARALAGFEGYTGCPIHVTGNPRIDLMRPEIRAFFDRDVARIRARFGRFVLINTNFSGLNHFHDNLSELTQNLMPRRGAAADAFMAGRAAFRSRVLEHFKRLIPELSRSLPGFRIVVRPHPSESHDLWREIAAGLDDVEITNEGNVYPWLMACEALIHNGCTTGVEARVLGTPAIAYQPIRDAVYDMALPNSLSHQAADIKDVVKTLRSILSGELGVRDDPEVSEVLAAHLEALGGRLAADRVVDVLEAADRAGPRPQPDRFRSSRARVHLAGRTVVKYVNRHRPGHRNNLEFHRHRFPGVDAAELQEKIARFGSLLGRFDGLRVETLAEHLFTISR
jgi:surface carbohydrate biosynthesis protein